MPASEEFGVPCRNGWAAGVVRARDNADCVLISVFEGGYSFKEADITIIRARQLARALYRAARRVENRLAKKAAEQTDQTQAA